MQKTHLTFAAAICEDLIKRFPSYNIRLGGPISSRGHIVISTANNNSQIHFYETHIHMQITHVYYKIDCVDFYKDYSDPHLLSWLCELIADFECEPMKETI